MQFDMNIRINRPGLHKAEIVKNNNRHKTNYNNRRLFIITNLKLV